MGQTKMDNLTSEQRKLVEEILRREDPQRKVDAMILAHKLGLDLPTVRKAIDSTTVTGKTAGAMNLR